MKKIIIALLVILLLVPLAVVVATLLWNNALVPAVTWANEINVYQMAGIMLLLYIIWPGQKSKITTNDE